MPFIPRLRFRRTTGSVVDEGIDEEVAEEPSPERSHRLRDGIFVTGNRRHDRGLADVMALHLEKPAFRKQDRRLVGHFPAQRVHGLLDCRFAGILAAFRG